MLQVVADLSVADAEDTEDDTEDDTESISWSEKKWCLFFNDITIGAFCLTAVIAVVTKLFWLCFMNQTFNTANAAYCLNIFDKWVLLLFCVMLKHNSIEYTQCRWYCFELMFVLSDIVNFSITNLKSKLFSHQVFQFLSIQIIVVIIDVFMGIVLMKAMWLNNNKIDTKHLFWWQFGQVIILWALALRQISCDDNLSILAQKHCGGDYNCFINFDYSALDPLMQVDVRDAAIATRDSMSEFILYWLDFGVIPIVLGFCYITPSRIYHMDLYKIEVAILIMVILLNVMHYLRMCFSHWNGDNGDLFAVLDITFSALFLPLGIACGVRLHFSEYFSVKNKFRKTILMKQY